MMSFGYRFPRKGTPVESGVSLDPLTSAWVTASGETDTDVINAVDAGIGSMKSQSIDGLIYGMWIGFGSSESVCLVDVMNTIQATKIGTVTFSSKSYMAGNGTNGCINTGKDGADWVALGAHETNFGISQILYETYTPAVTGETIAGGNSGIYNGIRLFTQRTSIPRCRMFSSGSDVAEITFNQGAVAWRRNGDDCILETASTTGTITQVPSAGDNMTAITHPLYFMAKNDVGTASGFVSAKLSAVFFHHGSVTRTQLEAINTAMRAVLAYY